MLRKTSALYKNEKVFIKREYFSCIFIKLFVRNKLLIDFRLI